MAHATSERCGDGAYVREMSDEPVDSSALSKDSPDTYRGASRLPKRVEGPSDWPRQRNERGNVHGALSLDAITSARNRPERAVRSLQ